MKLYTGHLHDIPSEQGTEEGEPPQALLETTRQELAQRLATTPGGTREHTDLLLELAHTLLRMDRNQEAWDHARRVFDACVDREDWETAVEASEILFRTEQPLSLAALGHGIWLSVTFPVNPEITIEMLRLIIDETPDDADGAAVAAATAHYVADLRAEEGRKHENLTFYAGQMLSNVARRHSQVKDQAEFDAWVRRLELDAPDKFLIRLRNVVDVLVQDDWWIDRDALRDKLPPAG